MTTALGGVEDMLREFALSTKEGLALMVLAEALLRVPDARTADQFIEDKLGQGDFVHHETRSSAFLVNASAWALGMSARVIQPGETPQGTIGRLAKRLGVAGGARRHAAGDAADGQPFRAGRDHRGGACAGAAAFGGRPRYSFDMLGEGARTAADAERYFNSYASAIEAIGRAADDRPLPDRPGISVKLSALHPRFEAVSRERVMTELVPRLIDLARRAKAYRPEFHRRCRGSGPAGTVARRDRRRVRRRIARRLGRLWARDPGLSEARRGRDRLHRRSRAKR